MLTLKGALIATLLALCFAGCSPGSGNAAASSPQVGRSINYTVINKTDSAVEQKTLKHDVVCVSYWPPDTRIGAGATYITDVDVDPSADCRGRASFRTYYNPIGGKPNAVYVDWRFGDITVHNSEPHVFCGEKNFLSEIILVNPPCK